MKDDFEATIVVELAPAEVWAALTERTVPGEAGDEVHYVLPGFPSLPPLDVPGASCTPLEVSEERLLRVRKDHAPCAGTEIAVTLEQRGTGTRITIVQSGFGAFLDVVGRDTVFAHGRQIVADLQLYLERRLTVPGTNFGSFLGAPLRRLGSGLEVTSIDAGGAAEAAGLRAGDLLLTVAGIRIHDLPQLWTVLALSGPDAVPLTWARGRERLEGELGFPT